MKHNSLHEKSLQREEQPSVITVLHAEEQCGAAGVGLGGRGHVASQ